MKIYGAEGLDMVNPARRIAPVFALAAVLLAEPAVGASGSAGTAEGPESWEGAVIAAKEDFVLYYGDGLEVVDDPLAFEGQSVRQPCTSGSWGIQWKGCFPENTNPLRWYHLWVRMRADKKGDTGNAAAVGVFDPPRNFHPLSRAVTAAEMPVDEYRWIDAGHFRASKDCVVYISPVNNSENVEFFYVDRVAYAPDPEPGPHPEWVNSLKPRGEPGPELTLATLAGPMEVRKAVASLVRRAVEWWPQRADGQPIVLAGAPPPSPRQPAPAEEPKQEPETVTRA